jgi:hypothetical protein
MCSQSFFFTRVVLYGQVCDRTIKLCSAQGLERLTREQVLQMCWRLSEVRMIRLIQHKFVHALDNCSRRCNHEGVGRGEGGGG